MNAAVVAETDIDEVGVGVEEGAREGEEEEAMGTWALAGAVEEAGAGVGLGPLVGVMTVAWPMPPPVWKAGSFMNSSSICVWVWLLVSFRCWGEGE